MKLIEKWNNGVMFLGHEETDWRAVGVAGGIVLMFLIVVLFGVMVSPSNKEVAVNTNPWIADQHIPNTENYLHPLPCHTGELARVFSEEEGCYVADLAITSKEAVCGQFINGELKIVEC